MLTQQISCGQITATKVDLHLFLWSLFSSSVSQQLICCSMLEHRSTFTIIAVCLYFLFCCLSPHSCFRVDLDRCGFHLCSFVALRSSLESFEVVLLPIIFSFGFLNSYLLSFFLCIFLCCCFTTTESTSHFIATKLKLTQFF